MKNRLGQALNSAVLVMLLLGSGATQSSLAAESIAAASPLRLLRPGDRIDVHVRSATTDMALLETDAARVADKIQSHYEQPRTISPAGGDSYKIDVAIVNYSKGYDYIRAMLPFVGQIRVDALVTVIRQPEGSTVRVLKISRTLASGEITSAASRIEDIEGPLVESVVDALHAALNGQPGAGGQGSKSGDQDHSGRR